MYVDCDSDILFLLEYEDIVRLGKYCDESHCIISVTGKSYDLFEISILKTVQYTKFYEVSKAIFIQKVDNDNFTTTYISKNYLGEYIGK